MKKDLFLVIDMQNAYTSKGVWACEHFDLAKANILKILESHKFDVIFTKFEAPTNPVGTWNRYNSINKEVNESVFENEIIDEFKEYSVYSKSTYSCLSNVDVLEKCKKANRVILSGVVAECCVLSTALACIDEGIDIVYVKDAVAGVDLKSEEAALLVLQGLAYAQVKIVDTKTLLREDV